MEWICLAILGLCSGIISSLFGLGGGTILVPALTLIGYDITYAVGLSIMQMVFSSFLGSFINYQKKLIEIQAGILLGLGGLVGSSFSGFILSHLSSRALYFIFLSFLCVSFYQYFLAPKISYEQKELSLHKKTLILIIAGCFVGLFSSSLGVGGGLLLIPICGYFLGLNSKEVAPLGLFFICFSSLSGAFSLYHSGFIHLDKGILLACFSMLGTTFGSYFLQKISEKRHKSILAFIYLFSILSISSKLL